MSKITITEITSTDGAEPGTIELSPGSQGTLEVVVPQAGAADIVKVFRFVANAGGTVKVAEK
jgi:uncharacterized cupredoxin-like copper-binding protein